MTKLKLSGKELRELGFPQGPVIGIAMHIIEKKFKHLPGEDVVELLKAVLENPGAFQYHPVLSPVARLLITQPQTGSQYISLDADGVHFDVFGAAYIEDEAFQQMVHAVRLPVSVAGALMPDAHSGYGLPIGGVLATEGAIIPYGVGVDIGCRMALSIFDLDPKALIEKKSAFIRELEEATLFGSGREFANAAEHPVLDDPAFRLTPLLRSLHTKAWKQLGTSGGGNHFVEFGVVEVDEKDDELNVPAGRYLGLLSHSGSRGLGANIANHYTKLAKEKIRLPGEASNLAWLTLDSEEGIEYWISMNLAGDYASACHDIIHSKIAVSLGSEPIRKVENHHNFAWKEIIGGKETIVHRKGATPAGNNVLGIIPGSMTAQGFIVKGKGEIASLNSASHGAGRKMSRTKASALLTKNELDETLQKHGVTLIGGGLDEAPHAYKDIEMVMKSQRALVDVVGSFSPKIVRMDGTTPPYRKKKGEPLTGE